MFKMIWDLEVCSRDIWLAQRAASDSGLLLGDWIRLDSGDRSQQGTLIADWLFWIASWGWYLDSDLELTWCQVGGLGLGRDWLISGVPERELGGQAESVMHFQFLGRRVCNLSLRWYRFDGRRSWDGYGLSEDGRDRQRLCDPSRNAWGWWLVWSSCECGLCCSVQV